MVYGALSYRFMFRVKPKLPVNGSIQGFKPGPFLPLFFCTALGAANNMSYSALVAVNVSPP